MPSKGQQNWKINQWYAEKKRKAEEQGGRDRGDQPGTSGGANRDATDEELLEMANRMEEGNTHGDEGMDQVDGVNGGGGGAGGMGGGDGTNVSVDRPMGMRPIRRTETYSRSYIVYINNGLDKMTWRQQAGTTTALPQCTWNEGWQIIPWGIVATAITPHQWALLAKSKRYRFLSCGVTMDSIIPFQEVLTGGGTVREAVTSFSNRPTMSVYKDDGELLPDINPALDDISHNNFWISPYGKYTECNLKAPNFTLKGMDTTQWAQKVAALPAADAPQTLFSLFSTGRVKTMYPGQTLTETWKNPNSMWRSNRVPMDPVPLVTTAGTDADNYQQRRTQILGQSYYASIAGTNNLLPGTTTVDQATHLNNYADTGLPSKLNGPPYLLVRMEQYYQSNDTAAVIFAQAHLHYSITVETEEIEGLGNLGPYYSQTTGATNTYATMQAKVMNANAGFPADNLLHRAVGVSLENAYWS